MSETPAFFGRPREWAFDLAIATGIGVFLGVIGPFGSFNGGPLELRVFYWVVDLWIGYIGLSLAARASVRAAARFDLPVWFALPVGVAIGAAPVAILVGLFSARFWPGMHGRMGPLLTWYGQTLAIAEPCAVGYYLLNHRRAEPSIVTTAGSVTPPASAAPIASAAARTVFTDRLSGRVGRDLVCLQMEDHYVRAHTSRGSELVLLPLKAAIAEVGEVDGLQVHRSWWVARRAVTGIVKDGRAARVRLTNGLEAPVSRTSMAALREAGWLDDALEAPEPGRPAPL